MGASRSTRPAGAVPLPVWLLLAAALAAQLAWHAMAATARAQARALPPAPPLPLLRVANLGEPVAEAKWLMLGLQAADEQDGTSLAWRRMDYAVLRDWLAAILDLDPRAQYPLLAASEVYAAVDDPARQRIMLDFVYQRFNEDPDRRWPWLAQAALAARHRLHDPALARRYARAIRERATGPGVPAWARELEVFMAEDMNEFDSAKTLVGALLHDGRITDPRELAFLARRLDEIAARQQARPNPSLSIQKETRRR